VFLVNSRLGRFTATPSRSGSRGTITVPGPTFSRSYGGNLPSSLTRGLPSTLVYSTCPPVSVCGTGTDHLARGFSWQFRPNPLGRGVPRPRHRLSVIVAGDLPPAAPYRLGRIAPLGLPPCVPPSLVTGICGTGIFTRCPSPTPCGLGLGPTHPQLISMAAEPLGIRWGGFSPPLRYSYRHSHSSPLQPCSRSTFSADDDAPLPYDALLHPIRGFGAGLEPRYIVGASALDQ